MNASEASRARELAAHHARTGDEVSQQDGICPECRCRRGSVIHAPGYSCDYYTRGQMMRNPRKSSSGENLDDHLRTPWCGRVGCYPVSEKDPAS